jgi:hypothetical protein
MVARIREFIMTTMPPWREEAERLLPELAENAREAETPYLLWFDIREGFENAYEQTPRNESLIRRVYHFASWCDTQPQGQTADDDLTTCVAVCFYEHIPQHPEARMDMPRWFSLRVFEGMEHVFRYHLSDGEFRILRRYFLEHRHMYEDKWWENDPFRNDP